MPVRWIDHPAWILVAVMVFAASVGSALYVGYLGYSSTPMFDQWDELSVAEMAKNLFAQHNEHRIVVSRLIFIADGILNNGISVMNLAFVFLFHVGAALLVILVVRRSMGHVAGLDGVLITAIVAVCFFDGFQFENFISGFQHGLTGVYFFAFAAFVVLVPPDDGPSSWRAVAAKILALASALSMANGLLAPLILLPLALVLGYSRQKVIGLVLVTIVVWAVYLANYQSVAGHGSVAEGLSAPFRVAEFVARFLASSISSNLTHLLGPTNMSQFRANFASYAGLAVFLLIALLAFRALKSRSPWLLVALAVCLFVLGSAILTAIGRITLGPDAAFAHRYGSAGAAATSLALAYFLALSVDTGNWLIAWTARVICLAVVVIVIANQPTWYHDAEEYGLRKREAEVALLSAVRRDDVLLLAYPNVDRLIKLAENAKAEGLATFAKPWSRRLGDDLTTPAAGGVSNCGVELAKVEEIRTASAEYLRVVIRPIDLHGAEALAIVDADLRIVGFALPNLRDDRMQNIFGGRWRHERRWSGYAPAAVRAPLRVAGLSSADNVHCLSAPISLTLSKGAYPEPPRAHK